MKIRINATLSIERDRNGGWRLYEKHITFHEKTRGTRESEKTTYHPTLKSVFKACIEREAGLSDELGDIISRVEAVVADLNLSLAALMKEEK